MVVWSKGEDLKIFVLYIMSAGSGMCAYGRMFFYSKNGSCVMADAPLGVNADLKHTIDTANICSKIIF